MRHLFIINPRAFFLKGQVDDVCREIHAFFAGFPHIKYDIHITRWKRDAVVFVHRYVSAADRIVRVYAVGGMGTLFEVINGVVGLPNVQVACWPFGIDNTFLWYFGKDRIGYFRSLKRLVFSGVSSFDLIKCGNNYGICAGYMGVEAMASQHGDSIIETMDFLPRWLIRTGGIYLALALYYCFKKETNQSYRVMLDGHPMYGKYRSILIANEPYLSSGLKPAVEARPDDGMLDVYLIQQVPNFKIPSLVLDYARGHYDKWSSHIFHYRAKTVDISSEQIMHICIDGEHFYDAAVNYEIVPCAVDFVCPGVTGQDIMHEFGISQYD
jgi:diacylglycerol kinase family enzyme